MARMDAAGQPLVQGGLARWVGEQERIEPIGIGKQQFLKRTHEGGQVWREVIDSDDRAKQRMRRAPAGQSRPAGAQSR